MEILYNSKVITNDFLSRIFTRMLKLQSRFQKNLEVILKSKGHFKGANSMVYPQQKQLEQ